MGIEHEIREDVRKKKTEALAVIGLPELIEQLHGNPWTLDVDLIACGTDGKAIICRNRWANHIAKVMTGMLGNGVEAVSFVTRGEVCYYFTARNLTFPERHTLQFMTRYFDSYYPGFRSDSMYVTFPNAMHAYGAPSEYEREADAYEVAEVLAEVTGLDSDVTETVNGYAVVLFDKNGDLTNYNCVAVVGATRVLDNFSCVRKQKLCFDTYDDDGYSEDWHTRIGEQYIQQRRIENAVNAILARIDNPVMESFITGTELVENIEASIHNEKQTPRADRLRKPRTRGTRSA